MMNTVMGRGIENPFENAQTADVARVQKFLKGKVGTVNRNNGNRVEADISQRKPVKQSKGLKPGLS